MWSFLDDVYYAELIQIQPPPWGQLYVFLHSRGFRIPPYTDYQELFRLYPLYTLNHQAHFNIFCERKLRIMTTSSENGASGDINHPMKFTCFLDMKSYRSTTYVYKAENQP